MRGFCVFNRIVFILLLAFAQNLMHAQARPTASRAAALRLGGGAVSADSGIYPDRFKGIFVFADIEMTKHFGGEFEMRQVDTSSDNQVYERTYEVGARYHRIYGRLEPFGKIMVGRGVYNFPHDVANVAYNLYAAGAGGDVRLTGHVYVRAEYEYQKWVNFHPGPLTPSVVEIGAAYRF